MQPGAGRLVEHQPGDGQPIDDPALSWVAHGGGDDAWEKCQLEEGEGEGDPLDDREGVGEGDGGDPVLGLEGKGTLSSQSPDAEELSHRVEHHCLLWGHPHKQG